MRAIEGRYSGVGKKQGPYREIRLDGITHTLQMISYPHHEIHAGCHYFVQYGVQNLGSQTTPNDTIRLSFATPDTDTWLHMTFDASTGGEGLFTITEAFTGGGDSPTGTLPAINNNRNSSNTSSILSAAGGTAGEVSYDAQNVTGGLVLWSEWMGQGGSGTRGQAGSRFEMILKQNTVYECSLFDTTGITASLVLSWYEHVNKD